MRRSVRVGESRRIYQKILKRIKMKLYIDDIRPAPEGWQQARTVTDAIRFLSQFGKEVDEISLDHDISYAVEVAGTQRPFPSPENFSAVARFMVAYYHEVANSKRPEIIIHTANPVGAQDLADILKEFRGRIEPASRVNRLESEV